MSIEHIKNVARVLMRANVPLFLFGPHGIGKTSGIYQLFVEEADRLGQSMLMLPSKQRARVVEPDEVIVKQDARVMSSLDGRHFARLDNDKSHYRFWSMSAPNVSLEEIVGMPHVTDHGARIQDVYLRTLEIASNLLIARKLDPEDAPDTLFKLHTPIFQRAISDLGLREEDRNLVTLQYMRLYGLMPDPGHKGGGVWLIDELNRGFEEVEKAMMQIMLERRYLDYVVPDDIWICTTMNPGGSSYRVRELDPATLDRGAVLTVKSDNEGWSKWATRRGITDTTRAFADKHQKLVNAHEKEMKLDIEISATFRSLEYIDRAWSAMEGSEIKDVGMSVAISLLGREAGNFYFKEATESVHRPLRAEEVLSKYGWSEKMTKDEERDYKSWKVTKERARVHAMIRKANVKTELIKVTLDELKEWFVALNEDLTARNSTRKDPKHTREERGQLLNAVLFLFDIPTDISRKFVMDDLDGLYDRCLYWSGSWPLTRDLYRRVQMEYEEAADKAET